LKKFAKNVLKINTQINLGSFVEKFLSVSPEIQQVFRNSPTTLQLNKITSEISTRDKTQLINGVVNLAISLIRIDSTKPKIPSIHNYKYDYLKNLSIFQQLSGNVHLVGQQFCGDTDCQFSLLRLSHFIKKIKLKICIDAVKYGKTNYVNLSGFNSSIPSKYIVTNPAQIADSANTQTFSNITYVINMPINSNSVNNMKKRFPYIDSSYQIYKQCVSIQKEHIFTYYFVTLGTNRVTTQNGNIRVKCFNRRSDMIIIEVKPIIRSGLVFNVEYIVISEGISNNYETIGDYHPLNDSKTENVLYSYSKKSIFCNILRGPSIMELGHLCFLFQHTNINSNSKTKVINNSNQLYALNLFCDIKRSQDSAQIEMVKNLNINHVDKPFFIMTQDILCATKALIENVNVIIENKGIHYVFVDISGENINKNKVRQKYSLDQRAKLKNLQRIYNVLNMIPGVKHNALLTNLKSVANKHKNDYNMNMAANDITFLGGEQS
jgi:hypothetical protein